MKTKAQRKADGPGWIEVIFGAILSLALGVVLAALFLVFKPTTTVKELPKEPVAGMIYYIEGTKDSSKARELGSKRRQLVQGTTVVFNEDELNTLAVPPAAAPAAKKMELPQPVAAKEMVSAGNPNFRIRNDLMQIAIPVTLNVYETEFKVILQGRGKFAKDGETVIFDPAELYIGSCPLDRLPAAKEYVMKQVAARVTVPDDLATLWRSVKDATVEGSTVRVATR